LRRRPSRFNNPYMRTSRNDMTDVLVWELVSVRCALAQPLRDEVRAALRRQERAIVGALLDMGVLSQEEIAPMPAIAKDAQPPMY
jgi:hypothetical protein